MEYSVEGAPESRSQPIAVPVEIFAISSVCDVHSGVTTQLVLVHLKLRRWLAECSIPSLHRDTRFRSHVPEVAV